MAAVYRGRGQRRDHVPIHRLHRQALPERVRVGDGSDKNYCTAGATTSQPMVPRAGRSITDASCGRYEVCPRDKIKDPAWTNVDGITEDVQRERRWAHYSCTFLNAVVNPSNHHNAIYFGNQCQYSCNGYTDLTFRSGPATVYSARTGSSTLRPRALAVPAQQDADRGSRDLLPPRPVRQVLDAGVRLPYPPQRTCLRDAVQAGHMAVGVNVEPSPWGRMHSPSNRCCLNDPYPKCKCDTDSLFHHCMLVLKDNAVCTQQPSMTQDPTTLSNCIPSQCRIRTE